jgi:hypothetical protein
MDFREGVTAAPLQSACCRSVRSRAALVSVPVNFRSAVARSGGQGQIKADPIYCAIAAYRGWWERPDIMFADAAKATVVKEL